MAHLKAPQSIIKIRELKLTVLRQLKIYNLCLSFGFFGLVIKHFSWDIKIPHKINGFYISRLSIDYIDIIINIKNAKLYIDSVVKYFQQLFKVI